MSKKTQPSLANVLLDEFAAIVGYRPILTAEYTLRLEALAGHLAARTMSPPKVRRKRLIAAVNRKFDFNRDGVARVFSVAASQGVLFNYHEKTAVQAAFDHSEKMDFLDAIVKTGNGTRLHDELVQLFAPLDEADTLARFSREILSPSKLRVELGSRAIGNDIAVAAFSAFLFGAAESRVLHEFFDKTYREDEYEASYWKQLRKDFPTLYSRTRSLEVINVGQSLQDEHGSLEALEDALFSQITESYASLENHGHLAIWLSPIEFAGRSVTWELASDVMLFAEKHDEVQLKSAYFRHKEIALQTNQYVPGINPQVARFEVANEGFTYRDTFVCPPNNNSKCGEESLLLIFQKNKRDETLIPCPACRSHEVQGNSYPSLGVRSWECCNLLCPDRSKYNRGKRYSFKALLMQEAIEERDSQIPPESVRSWSRDVQVGRDYSAALEMLVRHYSLAGDGILLRFPPESLRFDPAELARSVKRENSMAPVKWGLSKGFFGSAWFQRYAMVAKSHQGGVDKSPSAKRVSLGGLTLVNGDSAVALSSYPDDYFDAAVTSPPYFNAREYAQWPNIYCHMFDMQRISEACFRVLKPGGYYLYNVFDYFDNENSVVFSAMGDKRLILSAYTIDCFRRAGFELLGSVAWDKGEIEGKRAFNSGNFSPYYQAPFNCWEHVLVFRKAGGAVGGGGRRPVLPAVLRAKPVMKMVRGENVLGHTAPYPVDIPNLLRSLMPNGGRVLDPFGGSGTTARALRDYASEIVCIERSEEYCELALRLFEETLRSQGQSQLFE
jgi:DNA modification methylase